MTHSFFCLALMLGAANALAGPPSDQTALYKNAAESATRSAFVAEVEVSLGGLTRHGRIIVTPDGSISLEHLDEPTRHWVGTIMRPEPRPGSGWNDRLCVGPRRFVWGHVGGTVVPVEIHAREGNLKVSQHRLFAAR